MGGALISLVSQEKIENLEAQSTHPKYIKILKLYRI